jgi:hypothetical protein
MAICTKDSTYLAHLVGLRLTIFPRLDVNNLRPSSYAKYMMIALDMFCIP